MLWAAVENKNICFPRVGVRERKTVCARELPSQTTARKDWPPKSSRIKPKACELFYIGMPRKHIAHPVTIRHVFRSTHVTTRSPRFCPTAVCLVAGALRQLDSRVTPKTHVFRCPSSEYLSRLSHLPSLPRAILFSPPPLFVLSSACAKIRFTLTLPA